MAYTNYRSLMIDHTQCGSSDSSNFPVLFAGTYTYLKTVANGGKVEHASGYDIAFFSDLGLTTALDFERVSWDASTGACEFWVKLPTLDHSTDSVFYLAYGDASISSDPQTGAATWDSNYKAVFHLQEDSAGSAPQFHDSTTSANHLTIGVGNPSWGTGSSSVTSISGKASNGAFFSNPDQYAGKAAKSSNSSGMGSGETTIEGWLNVHSFIETDGGSGAFGCNPNDSYPYTYNGIDVRSDSKIQFIRGNDYNGAFIAGPSGTLSTGTWYHVAGVHDGANALLYINGSLADTTSVGSGTVDNTIWLGFMDRSGDVKLDEVRFSSGVRSADWILASYNNQNDPSGFYTIGDEVSGITKGSGVGLAGLFETSDSMETGSYGASIAGGAGTLIVAVVLWEESATSPSITDDQSNTYQQAFDSHVHFTLDSFGIGFYYNVFFAVDVAASATPVFTVTFLDGSPQFGSMTVSDYSGFTDTPSVDVKDSVFSTGSHMISPSITTTVDADLVLAFDFNDTGSSTTVNAPFNYLSADGFGLGDVAYLVGDIDDYSANFGLNLGSQWAAGTVAFRSGEAEEPAPTIVYGFFNVPAQM